MESILFEQVTVGGVTLQNRISMSAAACYNADATGDIDYGMPMLHFAVAEGGCALVPTGGVNGIHPSGRTNATRPMFDSDEQIPSFRAFAEGVRRGSAPGHPRRSESGFPPALAPQETLCGLPLPAAPEGGAGRGEPRGRPGDGRRDLRGHRRLRRRRSPGPVSRFRRHPGPRGPRITAVPVALPSVQPAERCLGRFRGEPVQAPLRDRPGDQTTGRGGLSGDRQAGHRGHPCRRDSRGGGNPGGDAPRGTGERGHHRGEPRIAEHGRHGEDLPPPPHPLHGPGGLFPDLGGEGAGGGSRRRPGDLQGGLRTPSLMEEILQRGEADFVSLCRPYIREPGLVNRWAEGATAPGRNASPATGAFGSTSRTGNPSPVSFRIRLRKRAGCGPERGQERG